MAVTDTVAAVTQLALTGDVIPATWYHTIRLPNGKLELRPQLKPDVLRRFTFLEE
jgi:hypothetical protein